MKLPKINKKKRLVALLLIGVVVAACVHLYNRYQHTNQPDYWLSIPLHDSIVLYHHGSNKTAVSIIDFERVLDKACKDPKCQGVIIDLKLRFSMMGVAITDAQAIGNAIKNFQQTSNKKVIACTHGHTAENATTPYDTLIASYANEWHHDAGASIRIEKPYQEEEKQPKKLQIAPNLSVPISAIEEAGVAVYETRKEGKQKCSPEQNKKLHSQQQTWLRQEVTKNRGKKLNWTFMLYEELIKPQQAARINLIDQLVEGKKPSSQRNMYPYAKYKRLLPRNNNPWWPSGKVLIIDISGRIEGSFEQDEAEVFMSSSLEKLLNSMEKYDMVILLLNTVGGAVLAAEYMREKIKHVSHKNIPVIAIERNGCFSAGVWVASCCDKVLAYRSTGTGSIGIIVDQTTLDFTALFKKLNINAQDSVAEAFEKVKKKKDLLEDATVGECFEALGISCDNIMGADCDAFIRIFSFSSLTIENKKEKLLEKPIEPIIEANKDMQITTFIRKQPYFYCFFSEKERKVNQKMLNDAYKKFLDTVVEKNKQDPTKFDEAYGQGKLYLANKGFITDEFIEDTLLNTFKKLAEQENLKSPSYTWGRA